MAERGHPKTPVQNLVTGAIIQALENDSSRTALSNDEAMRASGMFVGTPPSPYTLRIAMLHEPELLAGLKRLNGDIARYVQHLERWYAIDATYFRTPYFREEIIVKPNVGPPAAVKVKNAKLFAFRGIATGIVFASMVTNDNVSDQVTFEPMFEALMAQGAIIRGGGILADAGFNAREFYDLVKSYGGAAFLDFDANAMFAKNDRFPHYNEQLRLYKENSDCWYAFFNNRTLIEQTHHSVKSIKKVLRAQTATARECEAQALIAGFNLGRLPELRLKFKVELPFIDEETMRYIEEAIKEKRKKFTCGTEEWTIERDIACGAVEPLRGWLPGRMIC